MKLRCGNYLLGISSAQKHGLVAGAAPGTPQGSMPVPCACKCVLCSVQFVRSWPYLLSVLCSTSCSHFMCWKVLNYLMLRRIFEKSPNVTERLVRPLYPPRNPSHILNCATNQTVKHEHLWLLLSTGPRPALPGASGFSCLINRWSQGFTGGRGFLKVQNQTTNGSIHPDGISFCFPELPQITLLQPQKVSCSAFKDSEWQTYMQCRPWASVGCSIIEQNH